jgi:hypothetical protein
MQDGVDRLRPPTVLRACRISRNICFRNGTAAERRIITTVDLVGGGMRCNDASSGRLPGVLPQCPALYELYFECNSQRFLDWFLLKLRSREACTSAAGPCNVQESSDPRSRRNS